ncbi:hypothetical protein VM1G_00512 [Cytospora mali]|uniref:Uncharacterized protein n=1 Tax=Cytospora mali TaxID=578113 RepID=A0A194VME2_CYTMA|nr:hypothetical protein VM1G_00512 [Valsa mali]
MAVTVDTLTLVEVSKVVSVQVSVDDVVVTVVSVEMQLVSTVMDSVIAGRGALGKVPDSTLALPDIAASDDNVTPTPVPVDKPGVLELLTGYGAENEPAGPAAETLSAVDNNVPVGPETEVPLANGNGVGLPLAESTVAKDVLVDKEKYVLVITDMTGTVPMLTTMVEFVPFEGGNGFELASIEAAAAVPVGPGTEVALDNEKGAEADAVRVLVFLVLKGVPVELMADRVRDSPVAVRLPTGSDMFVVVYGTEVVSCGTVASAVALVEFPDGGGVNARLRLDLVTREERLLVTKGTVGAETEVVRKGAVREAEIAAEALVENVLIKVKLVENAAGLVRTTFVEVEVVVLMATIVLTETKVLVLFLSAEDVWWRLDDLFCRQLNILLGMRRGHKDEKGKRRGKPNPERGRSHEQCRKEDVNNSPLAILADVPPEWRWCFRSSKTIRLLCSHSSARLRPVDKEHRRTPVRMCQEDTASVSIPAKHLLPATVTGDLLLSNSGRPKCTGELANSAGWCAMRISAEQKERRGYNQETTGET